MYKIIASSDQDETYTLAERDTYDEIRTAFLRLVTNLRIKAVQYGATIETDEIPETGEMRVIVTKNHYIRIYQIILDD
jgi:hypothetical protein